MSPIEEGTLLWQPTEDVIRRAKLTHYMRWLQQTHNLTFESYDQLWRWSVSALDAFWQSIWDYTAITASQMPVQTIAANKMPATDWFPGARLNYAENIFAAMARSGATLIVASEEGGVVELGHDELLQQTQALAQALRGMGVGRDDRVVAFLPNIPEAVAGLLATASLGAVWSSCSPDFGARSVLDRFSQIEPRVLLACDGYRYNGKSFDRQEVVATLQAELPSLQHTVLIPLLHGDRVAHRLQNVMLWPDIISASPEPAQKLTCEQVPFDHPLWVVYSSGTTGLPKPIVHGHGGILLEHAKETMLHMDLGPGDRFFWYTSTGWMMWNYLIGGLMSGASVLIYDGSPNHPDLHTLWRLAAEARVTYFGASAAFIHACLKADLRPREHHDLSALRAVGSTGSPLSPAGFTWVYEHVKRDVALESFSGGTDLCTGFVGGVRIKPVYAGELQARSLGASVEAYDLQGRPQIGEVGELVITQPMPSMPLCFWNDDNDERLIASYFAHFPGVWRHGDWIKINDRGGCVIYGRSDATINRHGVRMGTAEIYRVVESFPQLSDAMVVDTEGLEGEPFMALFLVMNSGFSLDDALKKQIAAALRQELSPRHVPDEIVAAPQIPYTLSGKKMEIPVRQILMGRRPEDAVNLGAMRNPGAVEFFLEYARRHKT